jgi:DNA-binding Lrp family transcriptional regulator
LITAYVFINVKRGGETKIEELKRLQGVKDVASVYGEYDAILKVEKTDMEDLQKFLVEKIRPINWVDKTSTMITVQKN